MLAKEVAMIELTEEQQKSTDEGYDNGPWDAEKVDRLRDESVALLDRYRKGSS
jgi:hypothetical protein